MKNLKIVETELPITACEDLTLENVLKEATEVDPELITININGKKKNIII